MNAASVRGWLMKWQLVGVPSSPFSTLAEPSTRLILQWESIDPSGGGPAGCIWHHPNTWHRLPNWHRLFFSHTHTCPHTPAMKIEMRKEALGSCESETWECIYQCLKMCGWGALIGWGFWIQFVKWVVYMWNAQSQVRRREVWNQEV